MKKALFTCFTATLMACTITASYSQSPNSTAKLPSTYEELISSSKQGKATKNVAVISPNENKKALRSFTRDYKNIANAQWLQLNEGFSVVYFTADDIKTRLLYNKKGVCESITRYYFEDKLPFEIRQLVKANYNGFSIYHIIEATINGITSYLVKMEDKTSWKTIKVVDGEMEVMEEYLKLK